MSLQNLCENVCWIQLSQNKPRTHNLSGSIRDLVESGNGVSINKILKNVTFGKDTIFLLNWMFPATEEINVKF